MEQTRLKQLREEAVLTVHELAEASGVSDDTISKIENGQRVARPSTLRKLASALNVRPQELRRSAKTGELAAAGKVEAPREAGRLSVIDVALDAARRQIALEKQAMFSGQSEGEVLQLDQRHANNAMQRLREEYGLDGNDAEALVEFVLKEARLEEEYATLRDRLQVREQAHS